MKRTLLTLMFVGLAAHATAQPTLRERLLAAEDARPLTDAHLATLRDALANPSTRRETVRALGRIERPDLIPLVAPTLADGVGLRAEAANALAQMARTPEAVAEVQRLLLARANADANLGTWESWGEIAAALGRLAYTTAPQVAAAEAVLVQGLPAPDALTETETSATMGAIRGLESLARTTRNVGRLEPRTWDLIRWAATAQRPAADPRSSQIRRLAMSALVSGGQATTSIVERALRDQDGEVRRLGTVAASGDTAFEDRAGLLRRALADKDPHVRWEALGGWGRHQQKTACAPLRSALTDSDTLVRLRAIDLLGAGCPAAEAPLTELDTIAQSLSTQARAWHGPAHALVALARQRPDTARRLLPRFMEHPQWQVRMYAARAAGALAADESLAFLLRDRHPNVREAALSALVELKRPEAVPAAIDALASQDYQLVITATKALADPAATARATSALITALGRITAEHKDTSRDPRMAILERLQAAGDTSRAVDLEAYLKDFDPRVAEKAAEILMAWTKSPRRAAPQPLTPPGVTVAALEAIRGRAFRVTIAGVGHFDIAVNVDAAPLSSVRFARRSGEGFYNGLTFHRVVPNFVIQGGSPGANEYMGDAFYMRDEVGLHLRGTVGISTRGRDTGDAQIFVNLVDSPRLDHQFTVFGTVIEGMEVVDAILEGDVIDRIEIVGR